MGSNFFPIQNDGLHLARYAIEQSPALFSFSAQNQFAPIDALTLFDTLL